MNNNSRSSDFYVKAFHERDGHLGIPIFGGGSIMSFLFFDFPTNLLISLALFVYAVLDYVQCMRMGVYICNEKLHYKGYVFSREITPFDIKCIRLQHAVYTNLFNFTVYQKDSNEKALYYMKFYSSHYETDEMNGLEFVEEFKCSLVEKKLASCIYDKEALDYILSLNPDIKVFYPEDF